MPTRNNFSLISNELPFNINKDGTMKDGSHPLDVDRQPRSLPTTTYPPKCNAKEKPQNRVQQMVDGWKTFFGYLRRKFLIFLYVF